jgi:hypothetical protein
MSQSKRVTVGCTEEGCGEKAAVKIKYLNKVVCKEHFLRFVERKALKAIEQYKFIGEEGEKWGVAMSGGKDSQVSFVSHAFSVYFPFTGPCNCPCTRSEREGETCWYLH